MASDCNPFAGENKQQYLDALNQALKEHPNYKLGMRFMDLYVEQNTLVFRVAPKGIYAAPDTKKALNDMATVLTLSGSTLPFRFCDEEPSLTISNRP